MKARHFFLPIALFCFALLSTSCNKEDLDDMAPEKDKYAPELTNSNKLEAGDAATDDGDNDNDFQSTQDNHTAQKESDQASQIKADAPEKRNALDQYNEIQREKGNSAGEDDLGSQVNNQKHSPTAKASSTNAEPTNKTVYGNQPKKSEAKPLAQKKREKAIGNQTQQ